MKYMLVRMSTDSVAVEKYVKMIFYYFFLKHIIHAKYRPDKHCIKKKRAFTFMVCPPGSFMVIAWLFCSSVGIVVARHGKSLMGSKLLCNLKYWFVVSFFFIIFINFCHFNEHLLMIMLMGMISLSIYLQKYF